MPDTAGTEACRYAPNALASELPTSNFDHIAAGKLGTALRNSVREIQAIGVNRFRLRLTLMALRVELGPKFLRCDALVLLEHTREISGIGETARVGDL